MAAQLGLSTAARNAMLTAIAALIDGGAAGGKLKLYTSPRPATGAAITTQTLLATLRFSDPCAPSPSAGVLTFSSVTPDSAADANGTAAWARITDSNDVFVADVNVGVSAADFILNTTAVVAGASVSCTSGTISTANA